MSDAGDTTADGDAGPGATGLSGLSRRRFLTAAAGGAAAAGVGLLAWRELIAGHVDDARRSGGPPERVLVVVQLGGGNDGLNTLVPHDGRYADARPTLRVAESQLVALGGETAFGLHPSLGDLPALWSAGRLAAIDGLGFPDQSRSHFAAMDTWWRAGADPAVRTGWLGRWLDTDPAGGTNPLRAIALGGGSPALVGDHSLATVVLDPAGFALRTPRGTDARAVTDAFLATAAPLDADPSLAAAQRAVPASLTAVEALARASAAAPTPPDEGADTSGPEGRITTLLGTAANLIGLGLGTRVIVVAADGFDTHTDQAGRHGPLLADLGTGLHRFCATLEEQGALDRVTVLTTSEFGRRVRENGSGTDHGTASVQFLLGGGLTRSQIVGRPELRNLADGDVPVTIDTRCLYAAALDRLGGDPAVTDHVLGGPFDRHGLVAG